MSSGAPEQPANPRRAVAHLRRRDALLGKVIERVGPCRLKVDPRVSGFAFLVKAILHQQISTRAAQAIEKRFAGLVGRRVVRPQDIRDRSDAELRSVGLSRQKVTYLRDLTRNVEHGLSVRRLQSLSDEDAISELSKVRGVGRWTAEMFLMFRLGRPDILPVDDFGLRKGMQQIYGLNDLPRPAWMRERAEAWRPYRSIGTWYVWRSFEL